MPADLAARAVGLAIGWQELPLLLPENRRDPPPANGWLEDPSFNPLETNYVDHLDWQDMLKKLALPPPAFRQDSAPSSDSE